MKEENIKKFREWLLLRLKKDSGNMNPENSVSTRCSKLKKAERYIGDADEAVQNGTAMYNALRTLELVDGKRQPLRNALRCYWKFFYSNSEFPKIADYEKSIK